MSAGGTNAAVYLDHNATTPLDPEVLAEMLPLFAGEFGNPSSNHPHGVRAHALLDAARARFAATIGADPDEIVFTGSGTEANNLAVVGGARANARRGRRVVTTVIEHSSVLRTAQSLAREGFEVVQVPVDATGKVDRGRFEAAVQPGTVLVSVMRANNEIGTLQDVAELAALARERGALFHTDAVQAFGKVPVDVNTLGVALLSVSAHKFYGPKGVGALFVRAGTRLDALIHGGQQERGLRSGTVAVPLAVGLARAAETAIREMPLRRLEIDRLADLLREGIDAIGAPHRYNGHPTDRVPGVVSVCFADQEGDRLIEALGRRGVSVSAGSACMSGSGMPSHVIEAIGVPFGEAMGTLRLSLGRHTSEADIRTALAALREVLA